MNDHMFVDETKHRGYVMVAAVTTPTDLVQLRQTMRGLLLPGQRRIHMKTEGERRKKLIADTIADTGVRVAIFNAGTAHPDEPSARRACLRAVVAHAVEVGASRLVLEQDDSLLVHDKRSLVEITRELRCRDDLHYEHARAAEEQLLALPDVVAWCWAKGGFWRQRVAPVVVSVTTVDHR